MTPAGPTYVDTSTLRAVARCDTEALLRYGLGMTTLEEARPLHAGTAFHAAMEGWLVGKSAAEALAAFDAEYARLAGPFADMPLDDRLHPANLRRIVESYLATHPVASWPFDVAPDFVEVGFAYPLDPAGEFVFCGRMDALVTAHQDREYYILEHKTTGNIDVGWTGQWHTDPQISGYIWAAQQHVGARVVGAFINGVEFPRTPSGPAICKRGKHPHGVPYDECGGLHAEHQLILATRSPEQLAEWQSSAIALARQWRKLRRAYPTMEHVPLAETQGMWVWNGGCRWCAFQKWCRIGRPLDLASGFMKHEPWEPFAFAFPDRTPAQPVTTAAE